LRALDREPTKETLAADKVVVEEVCAADGR